MLRLRSTARIGYEQAMNSKTATAAARVKGPVVWLDMDQHELDDAYDQIVYAPNRDQLGERRLAASAAALARIGKPERFAYGPTPIEALDVYRTRHLSSPASGAGKGGGAPVAIFVHGGAWRRGAASEFTYLAEPFVDIGAHFAVLDFVNVDAAGGSLFPMAEQVCRAIAWVWRNAASFGGDPERLYIGGQSSGAHLAAVALTTDWAGEHGLPADMIKGGLCTSGMYELAPVRLTARANYVKFTNAMLTALSPIRHLDRLGAPLIVSYGTYETPEFIRQAKEFAAAVGNAGKLRELIVAENYSHLELPETLCNPYGVLGAAVLEMMRLGPG